ncbi:MAG: hypothetical protein Q9160_004677 [Pyrenula sp. 1 TL-2023]
MAIRRKQVFVGRIIATTSLERIEILDEATLGVGVSGTIDFIDLAAASMEEVCQKYPSFKDTQYTRLKPLQFLFPGLIDSHFHAPQWPNLAIGMEGDLKEWLEKLTDPTEVSYSDNKKANRVYSEMVQKQLELGTTTCAYNSTIHYEATNILADMCKKHGQRAIVGKSCIELNSTSENWETSAAKSLEDEKKSIEYIQKIDPDGKLISPCVQPRGGPYCSPALMAGLGAMSHSASERPIHVQGHMCETTNDIALMKSVHPGFDNYSEMYKHYGLMHEKSVLAHCIHLSDRDIEILKETKAGVAHNPNSNTCLRDGECPVRKLLRAGVKVGLGTDCSAGYSTSILDAMRQASNVSRHLAIHNEDDSLVLGFGEIVYLATLGNARVLSLDDKIGSLQPGKQFDALMIDVGLNDSINVSGWESNSLALVKKWVFLGDDRSIRAVFVNGKLVAGKEQS